MNGKCRAEGLMRGCHRVLLTFKSIGLNRYMIVGCNSFNLIINSSYEVHNIISFQKKQFKIPQKILNYSNI